MKKIPPKNIEDNNKEVFEKMRFLAIQETINTWYNKERYDQCLFNAMMYLEKYPDNAYMKTIMSLCINNLHYALKEHKLAECIDRRDEDYPKNYNNFLDVLNNLRLSDLNNMSECAITNMKAVDQEHQMMVVYTFALMNDDKAAAEKEKTAYLAKYKDGRFAEMLHKTDASSKKKK